ncbi:MAG: DUF2480 family protein [Chitinophagales bacterium]|jgi:hypothetical protein|nr:DUF2480 family protein [Chitinophagales bacterium]
MNSSEKLINKVADSGLMTIDLEDFFVSSEVKASFDLKEYLFMGLILKEKDFRESLKTTNWEQYRSKNVAIFCSADAIIPMWAYMLISVYLEPIAKRFYFCEPDELDDRIFFEILSSLDIMQYKDQRVIIKGCSSRPVPISAFVKITRELRPLVRSLMYGEACSNVPLYKQKPVAIHT